MPLILRAMRDREAVPAGSTAAVTAIVATPLTVPDAVVMETVGPALAVVKVIGVLAATRALLSLT